VWEQLLGDDSGTLPDPAAYPDIVLPPDTNLLGGYKRPRAATSLSSAGDSEMGFLLSSNGDGLANVFSSLELSHLISSGTGSMSQTRPPLGASSDAPEKLPIDRAAPQRCDPCHGFASTRSGDLSKSSDTSKLAELSAAINSEDMDMLIQSGQLPALPASDSMPSSPGSMMPPPSGPPPTAAFAGQPAELQLRRARTSSDYQRPLWRGVLESVERVTQVLEQVRAQKELADPDLVVLAQQLLANFFHEVQPKLAALGNVGALCERCLAVLMRDAGLARGSATPESFISFTSASAQTIAAIKRYATSGMLAPVVSPRGCGSTSGDHAAGTELPLAMAGGGVVPYLSYGEGEGEGEETIEGTPKLHACKNCQRAKTACNDQRPCARCIRLGVPCDGDMRAVKRACAACKKSKVKCDLDDRHPNPCTRCSRLAAVCTPHVPNKKKARTGKGCGADDDDDEDLPGNGTFPGFAISSPCGAAFACAAPSASNSIPVHSGQTMPRRAPGSMLSPPSLPDDTASCVASGAMRSSLALSDGFVADVLSELPLSAAVITEASTSIVGGNLSGLHSHAAANGTLDRARAISTPGLSDGGLAILDSVKFGSLDDVVTTMTAAMRSSTSGAGGAEAVGFPVIDAGAEGDVEPAALL